MTSLSNVAVVVPTQELLMPVLDELIEMRPGAFILVDDGSGDEYASIFALAETSAAGTTALSVLTDGHDMWAKVACDAAPFLVSYVIGGCSQIRIRGTLTTRPSAPPMFATRTQT